MLIYAYLFALVVGGVLLGASVLLGGHDDASDLSGDADGELGLDAHADLDLDAHGELGLDVDADGGLEVDADGDLEAEQAGTAHDVGADHGASAGHDVGLGADFLLSSLASIRFWTFFLAFFGLTGLSLSGLGLVESSGVVLALAIAVGLTSGYGISGVIRWLSRDTSGVAPSSRDYVGKTVRVVVPVSPGGTGKVRLELKGQLVDVLAVADEGDSFASKEEAMIIEMDGTRARIARVDD